MRHPVYWLLPAFGLALASFECGALERQPEPEVPGVIRVTASADASVEPSSEVRPADPGTVGADVQPPPAVQSADLGLKLNLHIFGFSYHPDREGTRNHHLDNEFNVGLGLNYEFHNNAIGVSNFEIGFFRDSGSKWAKFAGWGYQLKLGEHWRFGADLLAIQSSTYNKGSPFVAPIPRLTYDFGAVKVNAVYIPKVEQFNDFAVFAIYFTVPFGKW